MKTINHQAVIGTISAKADYSISYRISTGELTPEQKAEFFQLQNQAVNVTIAPIDYPEASQLTVEAKIDTKTPSQRLRSLLFVLHKKKLDKGEYVDPDFDSYYKQIMESFITKVSEEIDQYE